MIIESEIPETDQGLLDYIRFGEKALKTMGRKCKQLDEMIAACKLRLIRMGYFCQNGKYIKGENKCQTQAS